jgi:hypothetical protein
MSMRRVMLVENQPELLSLMTAFLSPSCEVAPISDAVAAEKTLAIKCLMP